MTQRFRREVQASRQKHGLGEVIIASPPGRWVWITLAATLAACVMLLLAFGGYTARARSSGHLVPMAGISVVLAPGPGIVENVHVKDGDSVAADQLLLDLNQDHSSPAFEDTSAQVSEQIAHQRDSLRADLARHERSSELQRNGLATRVDLLHQQVATIDRQIRLQQKQVDDTQRMLTRVIPLADRGIISRVQLHQQYERPAVDARSQLLALQRQRIDTERERIDLQQQLRQFPDKSATERSDIEQRLADSTRQLALNEQGRASALRSPREGTVAAILVSPGQTVKAGQPLLSVLPRNARIEAQLLLPSREIGFIDVGATVLLRYPAYPYQKFGMQQGKVRDVARNALGKDEIESLTGSPVATSEPLYRVRVELPNQQLVAGDSALRLLPGMAVEADILLERRSLLEWVFEPVFGMRQRANS
ncbi:MAG: HlyD family efflux transporter periplasmic adaptor subunit [Xanthomonadales bacterium]|nr:HlyD family efflux transporter periplasmic adaptor subunit [Xanthomonadales bacterium]MCW5578523.1 HlyD family efflux transporter periplasmic adaptor subunit [Dokdonella sp.]MDL1868969.1 HlyD family efflux transporter periplasmic adaptor subunit [Gammaproteobacteria bacterium PRO6]